MAEPGRGQAAAILLAITIGGAALRLAGIGDQPLWTDEALTAVIAHYPWWALATLPLDPSGPLYYWLHQLLVPAEAGAAQSRWVSAVAGIALIPVTYAIARQVSRPSTALLAASFAALSLPLIHFSQEDRGYAVLALAEAAAAWAWIAATGENGVRERRVLLGVGCLAALAALYTHLTAFPMIGGLLLVLRWLAGGINQVRRGELYACWAAVGLGAIPEMLRIFAFAQHGQGFSWLEPFSIAKLATSWSAMFTPFGAFGQVGQLVGAAILVGLAILWLRGPATTDRRQGAAALAMLAWWAAQPLVLWIASALTQPVLMARTMMPSSPAVAVLLAMAVAGLGNRRALLAGGVLIAGYGAAIAAEGTVRQKEDWRGAARAVRALDSNAVLACPMWRTPALAAALGEPVPPILMAAGSRRLLLRERSAEGWAATYARTVYFRLHASDLGLAKPPLEAGKVTLRSLTVVESRCEEGEGLEAFVEALRPAGSKSWRSPVGSDDYDPALDQPAPVTVTRYDFAQPVTIDYLVPPDPVASGS